MQVKITAECSTRAFYNTLDLHYVISSLKTQILVFFWVAAKDRFLIDLFVTFDLIIYVPSTIFQLCKDRSS